MTGLAAGHAIGLIGDAVRAHPIHDPLKALTLFSTVRKSVHAAITDIRGDGPYANFCRSHWAIRVSGPRQLPLARYIADEHYTCSLIVA